MVPARAFETFNENAQDRYFRLLRQRAYAQAQTASERSFPWLKGRIGLTGYTPEAKAAYEASWLPLLEKDSQSQATLYRLGQHQQFSLYEKTHAGLRLSEISPDWKPHRFEVAVWSDNQLCGLASTCVREKHDQNNVMALDVVLATPEPHHPLRGHIRPIVQFAALAWAHALGRSEVHGMGPITKAGERAHQRLSNFGFLFEPRGDGECSDTTRMSVARNMHLLRLEK